MHLNRYKLLAAFSIAGLVAGLGASQITVASSSSLEERLAQRAALPTPAQIGQLKLDAPLSAQGGMSAIRAAQRAATGKQRVIVRLKGDPVARSGDRSPSGRISRKATINSDQNAFLDRARKVAPGSRLLARTQVVLNAVFLELDASQIDKIRQDSNVYSVHLVRDYELDLPETVPYIGATLVQDLGVDGAGVKVAVLDSGIDYYHADLGGAGDPNEYLADDPDVIEPGTFPTAKVVDGMDFVGSNWPNLPEASDPDPLDDGPEAGHGTHVGHIIGGVGGVAPGVDLYAVKVCSSVSTSCSGIALIQGMEFAADPDGDGDTSDAVDVINMSLGSNYGQPFDDDLSAAVENATALGILTVASAGNSGNKPYVTGTPAATLSALSVAQTQVPSAVLPFLTLNGVDYAAVFQAFSVLPTDLISGPLQYGDGAGGNLDGCGPFDPGSLAGLVVLIDRGACNFSLKISNVSVGGGVAGVIGLVAPGDPFSGGDGGDRPIDIPGYMISQADSNAFKAQLGDTVFIDPDKGLPLVGTMVGSSSRGPQNEDTTILKPEIGAPGASVSAIAGTGTGTGPFGGTSGAAPMVAGSAALLLQSDPTLIPAEVKARLMNTGETDIPTEPGGDLAPITRIGGGEVRVDQALGAPIAAWDQETLQGGLSFGFVDVWTDSVILKKTVVLRNYSYETVEYNVSSAFRYPEDAITGAVSVSVPTGKIRIRARGTSTFEVRLKIVASRLPDNAMSSGEEGANPDALTANEYDGYLVFDDGNFPIHMPWHVLPRKAAKVTGPNTFKLSDGSAVVGLANQGLGTAQNDAYDVIAFSGNLPEGGVGEQAPTPDLRAVGVNTIPVEPGFCSGEASFLWVFAINSWERQEHLVPVIYNVYLDVDRDGTDDYVIFNFDASLSSSVSDGRQVTWAADLNTGAASGFFFTEHAMNTANTVLYVCAEQVGLTGTDMLVTQVDVSVEAEDFYYGGPGDFIGGLTITPLGERFLGVTEDIDGKDDGALQILDFGQLPGNTRDRGVMLITNGDRGAGNRGGATKSTEAKFFREE